MIKYQSTKVDGLNIFYREAGDANRPTMVLLHGFPSSSHMFRDLMPLLSDRFHLLAPDYPGFGQSDAPDRDQFAYTFDHLTEVVTDWLVQLHETKFLMYVFDYGAPIGFRIAMRHPDWIQGIVSQNGNVYQAGLGPKWAERRDFWQRPTASKRAQYRNAFAPATIRGQYLNGAPAMAVGPDGYTLDIAYTRTAGYAERQLDLIYDYQTNVRLYPRFQEYIRQHQPRLLAVWGKNDASFIYPGALAFRRDAPRAKVVLLDTGHFALESHAGTIAQLIKEYFTGEQ